MLIDKLSGMADPQVYAAKRAWTAQKPTAELGAEKASRSCDGWKTDASGEHPQAGFDDMIRSFKQQLTDDLKKQEHIEHREQVKSAVESGTYEIDAGTVAAKLAHDMKIDFTA